MDEFTLSLSADEFQLVQDIFAGEENPEVYQQELNQIIDNAIPSDIQQEN